MADEREQNTIGETDEGEDVEAHQNTVGQNTVRDRGR